jgi:hypothetical protein
LALKTNSELPATIATPQASFDREIEINSAVDVIGHEVQQVAYR